MQPHVQIGTSTFARAVCAVLCCALVACGAVLAQSGRRQPKSAEIAPVPTPTPEPTPIPRETVEIERIPIMLLSDESQSFDSPRDYAYLVRDAIAQRMREAKSFDITGGAKSANRGEAHKLAKLEKKRFVVWFRLVVPGMSGQDILGQSSQDINVEFVVLEPETGKQKASGRAYVGSRRTGIGGIGIPGGGGGGLPGGNCYPTGTTREGYYLVEASIEAADRVIAHFGVPLPPRCS